MLCVEALYSTAVIIKTSKLFVELAAQVKVVSIPHGANN